MTLRQQIDLGIAVRAELMTGFADHVEITGMDDPFKGQAS
jgi:hypothetical protein